MHELIFRLDQLDWKPKRRGSQTFEDSFGFTESHEVSINEDTKKIVANRLARQRGTGRAVNSTATGDDSSLSSQDSANLVSLLFNEPIRVKTPLRQYLNSRNRRPKYMLSTFKVSALTYFNLKDSFSSIF